MHSLWLLPVPPSRRCPLRPRRLVCVFNVFRTIVTITRRLTPNPQSDVGQVASTLDAKNAAHDLSSLPVAKRQGDTKKSEDGKDVITTSKSEGTTDDKIGYSWRSTKATDVLSKREEDTKKSEDGKDVITTSKSEGTTDDKIGYSWRSTKASDVLG